MRWIVDAMNVIGSRPDRWWNDPDRAMREFTSTLDRYAVRTGSEMTVVFDKDPRGLPETQQIEVVIARRRGRNAADYEIERIVSEVDDPSELLVVTSDKRLVEKVTELGAKVTSAGRFRSKLDG